MRCRRRKEIRESGRKKGTEIIGREKKGKEEEEEKDIIC